MAEVLWLQYAGLASASLDVDTFDLGQGVTVSRTFAHLMAPFMMAFAPAEPGKPHPAPWAAVSGGLGFDILVQLRVPSSLELELAMSPSWVIWWITAMIRLRVGPKVIVPVLSTHSFSEARNVGKTARFRPMEVEPQFLNFASEARSTITEVDLAWIRRHWVESAELIAQSASFRLLIEAIDQCIFARHENLALLWLWGGLESLFSPAKTELRYRTSSAIACFLEPSGLGRMSLQKATAKLYDSRSDAAHGREGSSAKLPETYALARRVAQRIIEENHVPTHSQLEAKLFGADPT